MDGRRGEGSRKSSFSSYPNPSACRLVTTKGESSSRSWARSPSDLEARWGELTGVRTEREGLEGVEGGRGVLLVVCRLVGWVWVALRCW